MNKNEVGWKFDNSYVHLPETFFAHIKLDGVESPKIVTFNHQLATELGLNSEVLQQKDMGGFFSGNELPQGAVPIAQAYGGHQFGHFNMLGDGRAVLLGEQITPTGERVDIQLKGAGKTPYSRGGDGLATLGPMLREYIISEAMYGLGIPTTRSLAVVTTGEEVARETYLPGAILTRVAASHLRVGTFQYARQWTTDEELCALVDYTIQRHYPHVAQVENPYLALLQQVISQQVNLIVNWQLVGFIHGVMNTDNMAISGETIDYGPCAFMDTYNPETVFSSIDRQGRYAFGNQPKIAGWNLARFAETLLPLIADEEEVAIELAEKVLSQFGTLFHKTWLAGMRGKLGLFGEEKEDEVLIEELLQMMEKFQADYTNTFRSLTLDQWDDSYLFGTEEFTKWQERWNERRERQAQSKEDSMELMRNTNPAIIPRNHRVEEALKAAVEHGDYTVMERLLAVLANPFAYSVEQEEYTSLPVSATPYQTFCGT